MSKETMSRRGALKRALTVVGSITLVPVINACGGEEGLNCDDTAGLPPGDVATRTANGYIEQSRMADKNCLNCQFWEGQANACGTCTVVRGPINPQGYCNLWAATQS